MKCYDTISGTSSCRISVVELITESYSNSGRDFSCNLTSTLLQAWKRRN